MEECEDSTCFIFCKDGKVKKKIVFRQMFGTPPPEALSILNPRSEHETTPRQQEEPITVTKFISSCRSSKSKTYSSFTSHIS
jgi:hypothetical protein